MSEQFRLTGRCGAGIQELSKRLAQNSSSYKKVDIKKEAVNAKPLVRIFTDFDGTLNPGDRDIDRMRHFQAVEAMKRQSAGLLELNITTGRVEKGAQLIIRPGKEGNDGIPEQFVSNGLVDNVIACDGGFVFKVDNQGKRLVYNDEMNQEISKFIEEKSNYSRDEVEDVINSSPDLIDRVKDKYYDSRNHRFILTCKTKAASRNVKNSLEYELQARGIKAKTTLKNVKDTQSYFKANARDRYISLQSDPGFNMTFQQFVNKLYIKPLEEEELFDASNLYKENVLQIIPDVRDFITNKHVQVMEGIERAKKEGGLVIAMGNDVNDFTMLNPLTYVLPAGMNLPDNEMDASNLLCENPQLINDIDALPLKLALIGKDMENHNPDMYKMFKFFAQTFPNQFIMTEEYNYDNFDNDYYTDVVQKSVYSYAKKNKDFMERLAKAPSFLDYVMPDENAQKLKKDLRDN